MNTEHNGEARTVYQSTDSQTGKFLEYRLNTDLLLKDIREAISGKTVSYQEVELKDGTTGVQLVERQEGEPLLNNEGMRSFFLRLKMHLNPQVVQCNLPTIEFWGGIVADIRQSTANILVENKEDWGLKEEHLHLIQDTVIETVELFLTRGVGDKERGSYNSQFSSQEVVKEKEKSGFSLTRLGLKS